MSDEINDQLLDGASTGFDLDKLKEKCPHYFVRVNASEVQCRRCHLGFLDGGRMELKDGEVVSVH